jgi:hypothetical protein
MTRIIVFLVTALAAWPLFGQRGPEGCSTGNCGVQQQPAWQQANQGIFGGQSRREDRPGWMAIENTPKSPGQLPQGRNPAVCWIKTETNSGSGTLVDERWVLTARHLWTNLRTGVTANGPVVVWCNGVNYPGKLILCDQYSDLAAIQIAPVVGVTPIKIADKHPKAGESVTLIGYGYNGQQYAHNRGTVLGYCNFWSDAEKSREAMQTTCKTRDGDSGGPVLNAAGELVAIMSRYDDRGATPLSWGTYCGKITTFIAQAENVVRPLPPAPNVEGTQLASDRTQERDRILGGRRDTDDTIKYPMPTSPVLEPLPLPDDARVSETPTSEPSDSAVQAGLDRIKAEAERQAAGLKAELGTLAERIEQASPDVAAELENIATLRQDFDDLKASIEALKTIAASDPKTLEEVQAVLGSIRDVSDNVGKLAGTVADLQSLPDQVRETASTVEATQESVAELRESQDEAIQQTSKLTATMHWAAWWFGVPVAASPILMIVIIVLLLIRRDFRRARKGEDPTEIRKLGLKLGGQVGAALVRTADVMEGADKYGHDKINQAVEAAKSVVEGAVGRAVDAVKPAKQKPVE